MNQLSYIRIYALQYQYLFNDLASLLWYRLMMIDWSTFIFLFFNQTLVLYKSIGMYVHTITFSNEERERERERERVRALYTFPFVFVPRE